jgi:hypothetical protein
MAFRSNNNSSSYAQHLIDNSHLDP